VKLRVGPRLFFGLDQVFGKQLSFPGQGAGAVEISGICSVFRLIHELANLIDHVLLVRGELASSDFLQIFLGRSQHLIGSVPLVRRLARRAPSQLQAGVGGSSLAHDYFRGWAV
jgi:hypothetical protein